MVTFNRNKSPFTEIDLQNALRKYAGNQRAWAKMSGYFSQMNKDLAKGVLKPAQYLTTMGKYVRTWFKAFSTLITGGLHGVDYTPAELNALRSIGIYIQKRNYSGKDMFIEVLPQIDNDPTYESLGGGGVSSGGSVSTRLNGGRIITPTDQGGSTPTGSTPTGSTPTGSTPTGSTPTGSGVTPSGSGGGSPLLPLVPDSVFVDSSDNGFDKEQYLNEKNYLIDQAESSTGGTDRTFFDVGLLVFIACIICVFAVVFTQVKKK